MNKDTLLVKVVEITDSTAIYTKISAFDEPLRHIALRQVSKIIYANGLVDIFNGRNRASRPRPPKPYQEFHYKNGLCFGVHFGFGNMKYVAQDPFSSFYDPLLPRINKAFLHAGISLRQEFYFTKREKWRPGFAFTWLKTSGHTAYLAAKYGATAVHVASTGCAGLINAFKFSKNRGLEFRLAVGPALLITDNLTVGCGGASFDLALRLNRFTFGLDYHHFRQMMFLYDRGNVELYTVSFNAGLKF